MKNSPNVVLNNPIMNWILWRKTRNV